MLPQVTGVILAGGKSTRIGKNKALLKLNKCTVIEHMLKEIKKVFSNVMIVANHPQDFRFSGIQVIEDIIPEKGPLGGIYTGLVKSKTKYIFVFACDMPFVNIKLVKYMLGLKKRYDVLVPYISNRGYETLHAIYSTRCIKYIERMINREKLKVVDFYRDVDVRVIPEVVVRSYDKDLLCFFNINTARDYKMAKEILFK
jgi:molybdopterin-guanine dinucleotide biosynthesis protein A